MLERAPHKTEIVKIRPFRYGNVTSKFLIFTSDTVLKSDRFGMEILIPLHVNVLTLS